MLSSGPSSSDSGRPGARGQQHLLAKRVCGAYGSAPGSGNMTLETRLLAVRSGPCDLGTGPRTRAPAFGLWLKALRPGLRVLRCPRPKLHWDLRSVFRAPDVGLRRTAPGSAPIAVVTNIPVPPMVVPAL